MHYHYEDVRTLVAKMPLWPLMGAQAALAPLQAAVRAGDEIRHLLLEYPVVRYERLDLHYQLRQAVTLLDAELVADLCEQFGKDGVTFAALLAALSPQREFAASLARTKLHDPWLVNLAVALCSGNDSLEQSPQLSALKALSTQVLGMPAPSVRSLRAAPALSWWRDRQVAVGQAYRAQGANAALAVAARYG